jgi:hypothetical protein
MNRKKLSFGVVAVLLGAAASAWVVGRGSEPSPPPAAGSAPEPHAGSTPSPRAVHAEPGRGSVARAEETPAPTSAEDEPSPRPRAEGEWQGMKVDDAETWPCGERCSMARACVEGECVPCHEDDECDSGEVCVLDHCVQEKLTECRKAADCGAPEALCVLTGYTSGDLRGNGDMRAHCSYPEGGQPDEVAAPAGDPDDGAVAAVAAADRPPAGPSVIDELRRRARDGK